MQMRSAAWSFGIYWQGLQVQDTCYGKHYSRHNTQRMCLGTTSALVSVVQHLE